MNKKITIPIFPLEGVILFPKIALPLNIFEDRYLQMIDFALSSNKKIGVIQPKTSNNLYSIGCIGKINSYEETRDGRYLINIIGENYFKVLDEVKSKKSYRVVNAEVINDKEFENATYNIDDQYKSEIINKYLSFTNSTSGKMDINLLEKIDTDTLIKFLAMSSPFSAPEKQMLLETDNLLDLANKISTLFDYYKENQKPNKTIN